LVTQRLLCGLGLDVRPGISSILHEGSIVADFPERPLCAAVRGP